MPAPLTAVLESRELEKRVADAREIGEDWANEEGAQVKCIFAVPGYDMDIDTVEFQKVHMADFQSDLSDLSDYMALLAKTNKNTYLPKSYNDAMKYPDIWMLLMELDGSHDATRGV